MIPMMPPIRERVSASMMNWSRMSQVFAPMAMRMPISRVRSVTDTSMMFMIPMPPTRSETEAMAPSSRVITFVDCSAACMIWVRFRTREIIVLLLADVVPLPEQFRYLFFGRGQVFSALCLDHDDPHHARELGAEKLLLGSGHRDDRSYRPGPGPAQIWPLGASTPITVKGTFLILIVWPTGF